MDEKKKFNPYPEGIIHPIPKEQYPKLNSEHKQMLELFNRKKQLEEELKEVNESIDRKEKLILKQIDSGKTFNWCWKWIFTRTNISWKDVCIKFIGKKKVEEISARTEATKYPHVGIEGFHPRPFQKPRRFNLRRPIK